MWQQNTENNQDMRLNANRLTSEKKGSCRVYDNTAMSHNVMAISLGWKMMSTIFMILALYFSKKSDRKKTDSDKALRMIRTDEKPTNRRNRGDAV